MKKPNPYRIAIALCLLASLLFWAMWLLYKEVGLRNRIEEALLIRPTNIRRIVVHDLQSQVQKELNSELDEFTAEFLNTLKSHADKLKSNRAVAAVFEYELVFESDDGRWLFSFLKEPRGRGVVEYSCSVNRDLSGILVLDADGEMKIRRLSVGVLGR